MPRESAPRVARGVLFTNTDQSNSVNLRSSARLLGDRSLSPNNLRIRSSLLFCYSIENPRVASTLKSRQHPTPTLSLDMTVASAASGSNSNVHVVSSSPISLRYAANDVCDCLPRRTRPPLTGGQVQNLERNLDAHPHCPMTCPRLRLGRGRPRPPAVSRLIPTGADTSTNVSSLKAVIA